ncbi:hypothetical protein R1flu_024259 [Riccia fluitans]|uniref:Malectin-like domain-containing protein n=1 Tax=Riccia fluitans TaxID=41844 RepID=A0ABD1XUI6_9MARC
MKEGTGLPKQLYSYRSFTSGRSKDCYTLKVNTDTIYLLRVRLFPGSGGSSSVALPVDFSVSVNSNHWFSYSAVTSKDSNLSFNITRERNDTNKIVATFYFMEIRPNVNATELDYDNPEVILEDIGDLSGYVDLSTRLDTSIEVFTTLEGNVNGVINVNVSYYYGPFSKILLNGFEYYYLYDVDINATYSSDRDILESIKASFDLEDWKGDPCYPVAWDWVTCDSGSRIQTLNLTEMELSGPIPENISSLTKLTEM